MTSHKKQDRPTKADYHRYLGASLSIRTANWQALVQKEPQTGEQTELLQYFGSYLERSIYPKLHSILEPHTLEQVVKIITTYSHDDGNQEMQFRTDELTKYWANPDYCWTLINSTHQVIHNQLAARVYQPGDLNNPNLELDSIRTYDLWETFMSAAG